MKCKCKTDLENLLAKLPSSVFIVSIEEHLESSVLHVSLTYDLILYRLIVSIQLLLLNTFTSYAVYEPTLYLKLIIQLLYFIKLVCAL